MSLTAICRQFSRGLNVRARSTNFLSSCNGWRLHFSTTKVYTFHHRISVVSDSLQEKLRREYKLSDDFVVVYKEPNNEAKYMNILKYCELVVYASPSIALASIFINKMNIPEFLSQDDLYIGVVIVFLYALGMRFFANGFVKVIFYNRTEDFYRAYVFKKYWASYKYVDFKSKDLNVINLHPIIPLAKNFFKIGKQHLILHDGLFSSQFERDKLVGEAIEKWLAHWGK